MKITIAVAVVCVLGAGSVAAQTQKTSVQQQLNRAADGRQHTGTTFDGSRADQRRGGVDTPTGPNAVRAQPPAPSNYQQRAEQISREQNRIPRAQPGASRPSSPPPSPTTASSSQKPKK